MVRKRISFSISSDTQSVEARLFDYLRNHNKMFNLREAIVRSLKAYYLPWAYEKTVTKAEAQVLARHTIDELEFRIFQIRRHFLAGEPHGTKLSAALEVGKSFSQSSSPSPPIIHQNGKATLSAEAVLNEAHSAKSNSATLHQMLEDTDINPDVLDDF